jgi:hypothetical protein
MEVEMAKISMRYFVAVSQILEDFASGRLTENEAVARIAGVLPDCKLCDEGEPEPARIVECSDCNHWVNMED